MQDLSCACFGTGKCPDVPCVRKGFRDAYAELKDFVAGNLRRCVSADLEVASTALPCKLSAFYNTELTGTAHTEGAALAALAAQHLNSPPLLMLRSASVGDVQHNGFACPRAGNEAFCKQMAQQRINTLGRRR
jgi:hypothetical protein